MEYLLLGFLTSCSAITVAIGSTVEDPAILTFSLALVEVLITAATTKLVKNDNFI